MEIQQTDLVTEQNHFEHNSYEPNIKEILKKVKATPVKETNEIECEDSNSDGG
jgi:hypothetical protein